MKIEETVLNILKDADLETATEYSVRATASQQLCIDLSDLASKIFIRQVLESFLLSEAASTTPDDVGNDKVSVPEETRHASEVGEEQQDMESKLSNSNIDSAENNGRVICKLSSKRKVAIHKLRKGQTLVSIRDYYEKDGKQFPSGRGITLTGRQWGCLRSNFSSVEGAIARMQSKIMRSVVVEDVARQGSMAIVQNQMDMDVRDPVNYVDAQSDTREKGKQEMLSSIDLPTTSSSAHQIAAERPQPQTDACASPQGHIPNNQHARSLVPIMTTRFNGKNYHCWRHQMEFFLKQLNVGYVLMDSCPSIPGKGATSVEENRQAEAAAKKWVDDEYICRHSILNSLSDNLFEQYSKWKKSFDAKELWEELRWVYSEDFGTVRCEVNKYVHFEMVDGISVVEQVTELNHIANSITTSGIWIDENLHVSVIISKLPPSWKEYRAKLMYYEFLTVNTLVHLLKVEEESRNQGPKKGNPSKVTQVVENRYEMKRKEGKRLCYNCNKEGHISRYCPEKSDGKPERTVTSGPEPVTWRRTADS